MSEPTALVVVRTFSTAPDARVAQSVVEAAGIPSELIDEHIVAAYWLYSNAVGGVKLRVADEHAEEVASLLDTRAEPVVEDEASASRSALEGGDTCAVCRGADFEAITRGLRWTMLSWLVLGLPLVPVHHVRRCRQCGAVSTRDDRPA